MYAIWQAMGDLDFDIFFVLKVSDVQEFLGKIQSIT